MVPAPWSCHAAGMYEPGDDIGVHLTLNAEHRKYRWGPITHAPSLLSGDGGFPRSIDDLWEHADPEEVRRECRAQIERALAWDIDVTHLAPHLTAITLRPEFFDVYLDMAVEFALPIRLPSTITAEQAGFPFRRLAAEEGVVFPDHFDHDWRAGSRERVYGAIRALQPGVTEIHVQPAIDTPEVRALSSAADGVDRRPLAGRRRSRAARAAGRGRRRADRLQRPQGRAASRLSSLAAVARAEQREQRPGGSGRLQLALHVGDRRDRTRRACTSTSGTDTTSSASSGPSTISSFFPTTTRYCTLTAGSAAHGRSLPTDERTPSKRSRSESSAGIGPTSDRARIQSSHG